MSKKIIYYSDELNDEFSSAKIEPILIDKNYKYSHNKIWDCWSYIIQNYLSMPIKLLYAKFKFNIKFVGKEKFKECKSTGYFIYANHTQEFADTFIPSLGNYPKRNYFIVNPENVSMKGLKHLVPLLGAIPIPNDLSGYGNFLKRVRNVINSKRSITIYPEAHIWPYYTKIRNFKDTSFKYPVELDVPIYTLTNTYHNGSRKGKVKIVTYIDGPLYPNSEINKRLAQKELRDKAYNIMTKRSQSSTYEHLIYKKSNERE